MHYKTRLPATAHALASTGRYNKKSSLCKTHDFQLALRAYHQ
jgi:hypothetical protein